MKLLYFFKEYFSPSKLRNLPSILLLGRLPLRGAHRDTCGWPPCAHFLVPPRARISRALDQPRGRFGGPLHPLCGAPLPRTKCCPYHPVPGRSRVALGRGELVVVVEELQGEGAALGWLRGEQRVQEVGRK